MQRCLLAVLQFPQSDWEDPREEEAIIRRWLKLADAALKTDNAEIPPIKERRAG